MIEPTDGQRNAMLQLGDTNSVVEVVSIEILKELAALGLVYKRSDGNLDFTDDGKSVYDALVNDTAP